MRHAYYKNGLNFRLGRGITKYFVVAVSSLPMWSVCLQLAELYEDIWDIVRHWKIGILAHVENVHGKL